MAAFSKTDLGTPPHLRWSLFQQLVMVGFTTNGLWYFHVAGATRPSLPVKLKTDEMAIP